MNIVIFDYDEKYRFQIKNIIEKAINKHKMRCKIILCTNSLLDIEDYINNNSMFTLYLFDTNFCQHKINVFNLAVKIRKNDCYSCIAFISDNINSCMLTFKYKVQAIEYILKSSNDFRNRIIDCLLFSYEKYHTIIANEDILTFADRSNRMSICSNDIIFIESIPNTHKLVIHFRKFPGMYDKFVIYESLNSLEEKLGNKFVRCHKSYIINRHHIKSINKKLRSIEMSNGEVCYYSRNNSKILF